MFVVINKAKNRSFKNMKMRAAEFNRISDDLKKPIYNSFAVYKSK